MGSSEVMWLFHVSLTIALEGFKTNLETSFDCYKQQVETLKLGNPRMMPASQGWVQDAVFSSKKTALQLQEVYCLMHYVHWHYPETIELSVSAISSEYQKRETTK